MENTAFQKNILKMIKMASRASGYVVGSYVWKTIIPSIYEIAYAYDHNNITVPKIALQFDNCNGYGAFVIIMGNAISNKTYSKSTDVPNDDKSSFTLVDKNGETQALVTVHISPQYEYYKLASRMERLYANYSDGHYNIFYNGKVANIKTHDEEIYAIVEDIFHRNIIVDSQLLASLKNHQERSIQQWEQKMITYIQNGWKIIFYFSSDENDKVTFFDIVQFNTFLKYLNDNQYFDADHKKFSSLVQRYQDITRSSSNDEPITESPLNDEPTSSSYSIPITLCQSSICEDIVGDLVNDLVKDCHEDPLQLPESSTSSTITSNSTPIGSDQMSSTAIPLYVNNKQQYGFLPNIFNDLLYSKHDDWPSYEPHVGLPGFMLKDPQPSQPIFSSDVPKTSSTNTSAPSTIFSTNASTIPTTLPTTLPTTASPLAQPKISQPNVTSSILDIKNMINDKLIPEFMERPIALSYCHSILHELTTLQNIIDIDRKNARLNNTNNDHSVNDLVYIILNELTDDQSSIPPTITSSFTNQPSTTYPSYTHQLPSTNSSYTHQSSSSNPSYTHQSSPTNPSYTHQLPSSNSSFMNQLLANAVPAFSFQLPPNVTSPPTTTNASTTNPPTATSASAPSSTPSTPTTTSSFLQQLLNDVYKSQPIATYPSAVTTASSTASSSASSSSNNNTTDALSSLLNQLLGDAHQSNPAISKAPFSTTTHPRTTIPPTTTIPSTTTSSFLQQLLNDVYQSPPTTTIPSTTTSSFLQQLLNDVYQSPPTKTPSVATFVPHSSSTAYPSQSHTFPTSYQQPQHQSYDRQPSKLFGSVYPHTFTPTRFTKQPTTSFVPTTRSTTRSTSSFTPRTSFTTKPATAFAPTKTHAPHNVNYRRSIFTNQSPHQEPADLWQKRIAEYNNALLLNRINNQKNIISDLNKQILHTCMYGHYSNSTEQEIDHKINVLISALEAAEQEYLRLAVGSRP